MALSFTAHAVPGKQALSRKPNHLRRPIAATCPMGSKPSRSALTIFARMIIPADSFSGQSPERKAAVALRSLFTFVAARVVLDQLQGPAGPTPTGHTSYNQQDYLDLMDFLGMPMKGDGGDEWLASVMRKNHALALRLMEVREAYLDEFQWQQVAEMACNDTREANVRLMRAAAMASLQASFGDSTAGAAARSGEDLDSPAPPPPSPPPQSA